MLKLRVESCKLKAMLIGAHVSISGGFIEAFKRAQELNATALQFFAKSPRSAASRKVTAQESTEVLTFKKEYPLVGVIHASYLLNFAQKMGAKHYQYQSLAEDLENAEALDLIGTVVHLGKTKEGDLGEAIETYAKNIAHLINHSPTKKAKVILENTAGQGTEFGYRIEEWGKAFKFIRSEIKDKNRIAICFDTAHAFSGGYDLTNKKYTDEMLTLLDRHIGIKNIVCVHLNDSKKPLGARVDRHEDIGKGTIGSKGLAYFVKQLPKNIPLILETPETLISYKKQINLVRSWLE